MKLLLALSAFVFVSAPALADEFGSRFGSAAPTALEEEFDPSTLSEMAPAAGEETPDAEEGEAISAEEAETTAPSESERTAIPPIVDMPPSAKEKKDVEKSQTLQDL